MDVISVALIASPSDELRALIAELEETLAAEYPPEQRHGLSLDAIFQPHIRFFVARVDGFSAGCGGVALFDDFAEVKRMYVRKAVRGQGVAQAVLDRIEEATRAAGLSLLRLETGDKQFAALKMYERAGFGSCGVFGVYATKAPEAIATSI